MTDIAREMRLTLLGARHEGATICPSEVARAMAADGDWRGAMPTVHAAVDGLVAQGLVRLSWKGERLTSRAGPYRIAITDGDQSGP
ncbi:DUF3253 domain-containing protein [Sphingobium sp. AR-3-1]|uniref:DUF3253 domain-containing protein n=1 Tax=Sphingobium psychrophilum TaxID=2728834 RepID=A0A7X9WWD4_9SPHN|nr:DUF3253 domain-containing protein [Sphingobium psychrophilum]NML11089.1 DUF3253 domain-containing protein [Sphingobium psychrophilum]